MNSNHPALAVVLGGTGLVGRHLLAQLMASGRFTQVVALVRRMSGQPVAGVDYRQVSDFDHPETALDGLELSGAVALTTLGTTLKQAGSKTAFRNVDFGYNLIFAQVMRHRGARHFLLLSALGASAKSLFFYNRIKGELEQAIADLRFDQLSIIQPSLLIGEHEGRRGEALAQKAFGIVQGFLPQHFNWRPIEAARVAAAMDLIAGRSDARRPVRVYSNLDLLNLTGASAP